MPETIERLAVMQQIGRTYRAMLSAFEAQIGHGLPRWRIMLTLYGRAEPCSQKTLVDALHIDPGALTRQLKALDILGWISRSSDPSDNRVSNVLLTGLGREQVEACLPLRTAFVDQTLGDMPEQDLLKLSNLLAALELRFKNALVANEIESTSH